jgi:Glycosyl hydrolases family 39
MTLPEPLLEKSLAGETRMRMLYGVNEADEWHEFAVGPARERIWDRFRQIDTRMIRVFLFDKGGPDPVTEWPLFRTYVQAVLEVGATPMVTFAKFHRPFDDPRAIRWFATQCSDVVWNCLEEWGPEVVRSWLWCVWNEPNSDWIGGGLSFEQYRRIYEAVAEGALRWLEPHLDGRRALIGGPAVEGFQPFWIDWVWRFVNEIDNALIGFVDWHCYGDWREHGEAGAPSDPAAHYALMMAQVPEYEARATAIGRMLRGRDILNICGELNTHSHYWDDVRARFNQSVFGATFYTAVLLRLMRGGVDAEMFWTGTDDKGGYGMMVSDARPMPVFHAKRLCAQHVRFGDRLRCPEVEPGDGALDFVVAGDDSGRLSGLIVHLADETATYDLADLGKGLDELPVRLKVDGGTGNEVLESPSDGTLSFEGFGVAVVTNAPWGGGDGHA